MARMISDAPHHKLRSPIRGMSLFPISFTINGAGVVSNDCPPNITPERTGVGEYTLTVLDGAPNGAWLFLVDSTGAVFIPASSMHLQAPLGSIVVNRGEIPTDPGPTVRVFGFLAMKKVSVQ